MRTILQCMLYCSLLLSSACNCICSIWSPYVGFFMIIVFSKQAKDRSLVSQRMRTHVQRSDTTPLLIFPEGTCVNNEYCVMFKRGAFDLG